MFVFVCSAYIKVPICVLAGGSMGKKKGEVRCVGELLVSCSCASMLFCAAHVNTQSSEQNLEE